VKDTTTIRVSEATRTKIALLAAAMGRPMTDVVSDAVDALERKLFFADVNARYAELRADPQAWAELEAERAAEESALRDVE